MCSLPARPLPPHTAQLEPVDCDGPLFLTLFQQQLPQFHPERPCQAVHGIDGDVPFPTFDGADVGEVEAGMVGEG